MTELGIVDIREIIKAIKSVSDLDFSNLALTSFKQRLERFMRIQNISSTEILIKKLRDNAEFIDTLLYEISVPSTEMFRDPSLWRWLREEYFQNALDKNIGKFKIWLPSCVSGGELFSLAILLNEMELTDKVQIIATSISNKSIEVIKQGNYDLKKVDVSAENYRRFNGPKDLSTYFKPGQNCVCRNTSLIEAVEFKKLNINFDNSPQNCKLILFRNCLIYLNPSQQERILHTLYESLAVTGHLVLGIRERISGANTSREFEVFNQTESIYRKRMLN